MNSVPAGTPIPVATPLNGPPPPDAEVVFGIPIDSPGVAKLTRKVLTLSFLQGLVAIAAAIVGFFVDDMATTSLIGAALIPLCGFLGVRGRNLKLLSLFSFFNLLCCGVYLIALVSTFAISIPMINCLCDQSCRESRWGDQPPDPSSVDKICSQKAKVLQAYFISVGIGGAAFILQALGYVYGRKLSKDPYFQVQAIQREMQNQPQNATVVYAVGGPMPVQPGQQPGQAGYGQPYPYYAAVGSPYPPGAPGMVVVAPRPGQAWPDSPPINNNNNNNNNGYGGGGGFAYVNPQSVGAPVGFGTPIYPPGTQPPPQQQLQQTSPRPQQPQQQGITYDPRSVPVASYAPQPQPRL